jgi:type I restriction enzyme S subunit
VEKRLGEYLRFQTGFPFSSDYFETKNKSGMRLIKNRDLRSDDSIVYYLGGYSQEFIVQNGELLIGMDGDFEPVLWKKGKALLNQRVGRVLKFREISIQYLSFALLNALKEIELRTGSTTVKHLSHSDIENIVMYLPENNEQEAIAKILITMDAEIEQLKTKKTKYHDIKQGMMQELLTGKTRLV